MSDDRWRRDNQSETDEFGGPLFPETRDADRDDAADGDPSAGARRGRDPSEPRLRFGPDDTGPLPHWTDPPTGEVPRVTPRASGSNAGESDDDVDVWSTFTTESPVWSDDDDPDAGDAGDPDENMVTSVVDQVPDFGSEYGRGDDRIPPTGPTGRVEPGADPLEASRRGQAEDDADDRPADGSGGVRRGREPLFGDTGFGGVRPSGRRDPSGSVPRAGDREDYGDDAEHGDDPSGAPSGEVPAARREPGRITIGTDPSGMPKRRPEPPRRRAGGQRSGRPAGPPRTSPAPTGRDLPVAAGVGAGIAVAFIVALLLGAPFALAIVVIVLALAGWEYFGKVAEKGYRPAIAPGLAACVLAPLAAYFYPVHALPLVIVLAFVAGAAGFIGASGVDSGPLPNMAVTTMGVVWVGLLGGYAGMILQFDWSLPGTHVGTDTMFMLALGVAANDIGALLVGSLIGKTPLRPWVSPAKTLEGLLGGTAFTLFALFVAAQLVSDQNVWASTTWALFLALVIAVLAPLGDLTASMFKRNLEIKDFGTIVQGHGGVLDRFDGFLFALPGAYYVLWVMLSTRF